MTGYGPPGPLLAEHDVSAFANGRHPVLDTWLKERARASEGWSARTYVVATREDANRVVGYHCISSAGAERVVLPSAKLRRDMPDPVPLLLIGRLAVDHGHRGRGLGSSLLRDALRRCLSAATIVGARAACAHAIDDEAVDFYLKHGFARAPIADRLMVLPLELARRLVDGP
jgi:GNAT superfamily N-acetyltransferase